MRKFLFSFMCLSMFNVLACYAHNSQIPAQEIQKLLPGLDAYPNIKLYLPDTYVLIEQNEDEYFIGPNTLGKNFDLASLKEPALQVMKLMGLKSFEKEIKPMILQMKQQFPRGFEANFSKWGDYPLASVKMNIAEDPVYMVYAGLNDPNGTVLMFRLVYPSEKDFGNGNKPRKEDIAFWNDFLKKTVPLKK